ncbi:Twin arginine-targeting protein translocase TatB [uncultured delta proteobacterium]|uniref:Twin arginine-targeting protein translocase TatB n=1 Tax=uncultured delta proteobacterium TaxID=34034 RepID=A0A212J7D5_9DELT|nr:Twin arginine-targeting protein translocase TatB [uncultured delta proteobacterium]
MFNLGGMEIVVILVVALLVLGPDKLPNFMRTIGKAVGELRRASTEFQRTIHTEIAQHDASLSRTSLTPEQEAPAREPASTAPRKTAAEKTTITDAARKRPLPRAHRPRRPLTRSGGDTGDA